MDSLSLSTLPMELFVKIVALTGTLSAILRLSRVSSSIRQRILGSDICWRHVKTLNLTSECESGVGCPAVKFAKGSGICLPPSNEIFSQVGKTANSVSLISRLRGCQKIRLVDPTHNADRIGHSDRDFACADCKLLLNKLRNMIASIFAARVKYSDQMPVWSLSAITKLQFDGRTSQISESAELIIKLSSKLTDISISLTCVTSHDRYVNMTSYIIDSVKHCHNLEHLSFTGIYERVDCHYVLADYRKAIANKLRLKTIQIICSDMSGCWEMSTFMRATAKSVLASIESSHNGISTCTIHMKESEARIRSLKRITIPIEPDEEHGPSEFALYPNAWFLRLQLTFRDADGLRETIQEAIAHIYRYPHPPPSHLTIFREYPLESLSEFQQMELLSGCKSLVTLIYPHPDDIHPMNGSPEPRHYFSGYNFRHDDIELFRVDRQMAALVGIQVESHSYTFAIRSIQSGATVYIHTDFIGAKHNLVPTVS